MSPLRDDGIELGRRQHERFAVKVEAEVQTDAGTFPATTRDLSRGGVCFVVAEPLERGSFFTMSLSLVLGENTFSEPLVVQGRVVWCTDTDEGHQIGASLAALDGETREYLQMFLNFLAEGLQVGDEEGDEAGDEEPEDEDEEEKGLFG